MSAIQNRQPAGRPTGGQFAAASHAEAPAGLATDTRYRAAAGESFDIPEACDGTYVEQANLLPADDANPYRSTSTEKAGMAGRPHARTRGPRSPHRPAPTTLTAQCQMLSVYAWPRS
jgi:hypothetical protein